MKGRGVIETEKKIQLIVISFSDAHTIGFGFVLIIMT
jgi:hypothetical protein